MKRFEIVNDGPNRWVLVDNQSDDPSPVYQTEAEARAIAALKEIACGEVEIFDEDTGGNVLVSMSGEEAAEIARAAIAKARP
jgi:sarcosine oxidase gamma subunit